MAGNSCNNRCLFCSANAMRCKGDRSTAELTRELMKNRPAYSCVEFIGGEFTIRPDAVALVGLAKRLGYRRIALETNGKRFSYPAFARDIIKAGLSHVVFSVHGCSPATHDRLTGSAGAFRQVMAGLNNAAGAVAQLGVNFVVTKLNYREIPRFALMIDRISGVDDLSFSMVRPVEHFSREVFLELVPRFSEVLPYLRKALGSRKVAIKSFPPCLAPSARIEDHREKLLVGKNYGRFSSPESCYGSIRRLIGYGGRCSGCRLRGSCLGVWKKYLRYYGDSELRPVPAGGLRDSGGARG